MITIYGGVLREAEYSQYADDGWFGDVIPGQRRRHGGCGGWLHRTGSKCFSIVEKLEYLG
jgi:hypothetical protein